MLIRSTLMIACIIAINACHKTVVDVPTANSAIPETSFTTYRILKNKHTAEQSVFTPVEYEELKFKVKFDSSAIYSTTDPANQYDINKLYGFADNGEHHHMFSARIGWRWSDNALRLFSYIYNKGEMSYEELGAISIGKEYSCSIKVTTTSYIFSAGNSISTMPRLSTTNKAKGYKLFPYFGGDETAPHDINIWISE